MATADAQTAYWDKAATTKTFTHPLYATWLNGVSRHATVLDYGCGYGRVIEALAHEGFDNLTGVDTSPGMIAQARARRPAARFTVLDSPPALPYPNASIDVVLLFAVLTCIPRDDAQRELVGELARVLKPGGMLYLSDLLLQPDSDRYARSAGPQTAYGVFESNDGAVFRHHSAEWFPSLLADFTITDSRRITVDTMNGNEAAGIQILAHRY